MHDRLGPRVFWSLLLAVLTGAGVLLLDGSAQGALVALVGAAAAAGLVVLGPGDDEPFADAPAARPEPDEPAATLDAVLDAIDEPVLLVRRGQVSAANRAARALLGEHVVGEDVRVAIRHPAAAERLSDPLAAPPERPIDLVGLGTLDQQWQMRVSAADDETRVVHLVDQTGSRAAERMRVDFVANASHELRTPLAAIIGFVETLSDAAGEDPEVRARFLGIAGDEARRMQRLVDDLISLSRIEADKHRAPSTPLDLAGVVGEVRAELAGVVASDVVVRAADDLPPIAGDRPQLSQLLHNLVGNAVKYGRAGAPITVTLDTTPAGLVRLAVADQGDGIAAEHLPRLTERFYRVDAGRSRAAGGTGLGLAIVKHIVERHRGRLEFASVAGRGTTVTVLLPALLSSPRHEHVTRAGAEAGGSDRAAREG